MSTYETPTVCVSVRQTHRLTDDNGRAPERQVAKYIRRAFTRLGVPFEVTFDHPPLDIPDDPPETGKRTQLDALTDAVNRDDPIEGVQKDANLLLTRREGGGLSWPGGKAGIAPAGTLTRKTGGPLREWVTPDDPRKCVYGALHELAHMLSPHREHADGWGVAWCRDDQRAYYRTPLVATADENLCGERVEKRKEGYEKRNCLYFAQCAAEHIEIQ